MATYPAFFTLVDSTATPDNGIQPERATNGALRTRRLWPNDKTVFEVGHALQPAQKATLDAFYTANRDLDVTYVWPGDGLTYTVRFAAPPQYRRLTRHWEARLRLIEV